MTTRDPQRAPRHASNADRPSGTHAAPLAFEPMEYNGPALPRVPRAPVRPARGKLFRRGR